MFCNKSWCLGPSRSMVSNLRSCSSPSKGRWALLNSAADAVFAVFQFWNGAHFTVLLQIAQLSWHLSQPVSQQESWSSQCGAARHAWPHNAAQVWLWFDKSWVVKCCPVRWQKFVCRWWTQCPTPQPTPLTLRDCRPAFVSAGKPVCDHILIYLSVREPVFLSSWWTGIEIRLSSPRLSRERERVGRVKRTETTGRSVGAK